MSDDSKLIFGKELVFDEKAHAYTWGDQFVPGVTTILGCINKPALMPWAVKMTRDYWLEALKSGRTDHDKIHKESWNAHKKFSKAAADIGSNVHAYAEAALKGLPLPELLTDEAKRGAEAFHKWQNAHKIKLLASERRIFSLEHFYAGTADLIAEIDGEYCVGDFKTSSGIYPEMRLQTAAYQNAIQEEKGFQVQSRWIVRFDKKTGEFEAKRFSDFDLDFMGFKSALGLHRALQSIAG
jgi:hypothetical protein